MYKGLLIILFIVLASCSLDRRVSRLKGPVVVVGVTTNKPMNSISIMDANGKVIGMNDRQDIGRSLIYCFQKGDTIKFFNHKPY